MNILLFLIRTSLVDDVFTMDDVSFATTTTAASTEASRTTSEVDTTNQSRQSSAGSSVEATKDGSSDSADDVLLQQVEAIKACCGFVDDVNSHLAGMATPCMTPQACVSPY